MKTVTSISGGRTSAYLAANYPTDYNVFALVTTADKTCIYPDKKLRQVVSDKIGREFIGTLEDDTIIHTILDLEQYIGRRIDWVAGKTFEDVIFNSGNGLLPNIFRRYCTTELKLQPIFEWWQKTISKPCVVNIGYRANELKRAETMQGKLNKNGFLEMRTIIGKRKTQNKWGLIEWQKPMFPLIKDGIFVEDISKYWEGKNVRFALKNNCIGCFHRNPNFLKKMSELHEAKFNWFIKMEKEKGGTFKKNASYQKIKDSSFTGNLFEGINSCDSGYCGL